MYAGGLSHISAGAWVPEQLTHYVEAVSGRTARLCGGHAAYIMAGQAALVAYPLAVDALDANSPCAPAHSPDAGRLCPPAYATDAAAASSLAKTTDAAAACAPTASTSLPRGAPERAGTGLRQASDGEAAQLAEALEALAAMGCDRVSILAPFRCAGAAVVQTDCYWQIALPCPPERQKVRNLLRRAATEARVDEDDFGPGHQALVAAYLAARPLPPGTRAIFAALPAYARLAGSPGLNVRLYSARRQDGSLAGFAIGDFTGLHTAFYMFAFRARNAPPGTADLLLRRILTQAEVMGHRRLNLGLGVNPGIAFFKQKWGASPLLPYVESAWPLQGRSGGHSDGGAGGGPSGIIRGLRRLFGAGPHGVIP